MKQTQYVAREPDAQGFIDYPAEEHAVWNTLITRQLKAVSYTHLTLPTNREV